MCKKKWPLTEQRTVNRKDCVRLLSAKRRSSPCLLGRYWGSCTSPACWFDYIPLAAICSALQTVHGMCRLGRAWISNYCLWLFMNSESKQRMDGIWNNKRDSKTPSTPLAEIIKMIHKWSCAHHPSETCLSSCFGDIQPQEVKERWFCFT